MPSPSRTLCAAVAFCAAAGLTAQATLTPVASFGTNGYLAAGSTPYLSTGNTERGFAFNPVSGNLILVARQNVAGIANNPVVIDGTTGAVLHVLDNTGITGGTFAVNMADTDFTGAIYVGNLSTSAGSAFKVYKWDDETPAVPPTVVYNSVTGLDRTGDAFAVTFGPTGAQFAAAGSSAAAAGINSNFVVGQLDGTNTATAFLSIPGTNPSTNDFRLGLTFVDQDTVIGTQGATGLMTDFDTTLGQASVVAPITLGGAARRAMDYIEISGRKLLAVIDSNSSTVTVLDICDPANPTVVAQANNTTGTLAANVNGVGAVQWGNFNGSGTGARLYAMSTNQGLQAFDFELNTFASAVNYGVGCDGLGLTYNSLPSICNATFALEVTNLGPLSPIGLVAFGSTAVNPGIPLALIGMPGCDSYTSFDLGLFVTGPAVAGVASFGLPIPPNAGLVGATLAAQGLGFTLATSLGLSASNGTAISIGF